MDRFLYYTVQSLSNPKFSIPEFKVVFVPKMKLILSALIFILTCHYVSGIHIRNANRVANEKSLSESPKALEPGKKYLIRTAFGSQDCYITVHENGVVDAQYLIKNEASNSVSPFQLWSIQPHPFEPNRFELVQDVVPFNDLSGFENKDDHDPPLFPRPLTFSQAWGSTWQIEIRIRWCLRFLGRGYRFDIDDCELEYEPEKLWNFIEA